MAFECLAERLTMQVSAKSIWSASRFMGAKTAIFPPEESGRVASVPETSQRVDCFRVIIQKVGRFSDDRLAGQNLSSQFRKDRLAQRWCASPALMAATGPVSRRT